MNDKFVGDVGDFIKLGMLHELQETGFSIGINWYKTPYGLQPRGGDNTKFLSDEEAPDPKLIQLLSEIKVIKKRAPELALESLMESLTNSNYFNQKCVKYYNDILAFSDVSEDHKDNRDQWHKQALSDLRQQKIAFLDPDNGLEIASVNPNYPSGIIYATCSEVADYYNKNGSTVIVYQHWLYPPESKNYDKYIEKLHRVKQYISPKKTADLLCLKAQNRDFLFVMQPSHSQEIRKTIDSMLKTGSKWREGKYLTGIRDL